MGRKAQAMLFRCGHFFLVTLVRFKCAPNSRVDCLSHLQGCDLNSPSRYPVNRLRKPYRHWNDVEWKPASLVWFDRTQFEKTNRQGGSWVSHFPWRRYKTDAGTSSWPSWISHFTGSFVGHSPSEMLCPPAVMKLKLSKQKSGKSTAGRSFTSIYSGVSHTHTPSFFVTHHLSHTTLPHTTLFYLSVLHHILCLSFFPRPCYNIWCSLLEEVALRGYPVL